MLSQFKLDRESLQIYLNKLEYKIRQFFRTAWPIDWAKFRDPKLVWQVLVQTSYYFKVVLVSIFLALIISVSFLIYGFYLALTVPVAAQGGTIREGFVGTEINVFNPVLDLNPVETRIATLLFYPLYKVDYPDYLASQENPKITPILLEKAPEWLDYNNENPQNRYKLLRFTLKEGLKWSNGSEITTEDIEYTVERLREDRGNSSFREILRKLEFEKLNKRDFIFRSKEPNPGLIYALNFQPIPQKYFNFLSTAELLVDNRSRKPMVTSGLFKFPEGLVQHPNESKTMLVDNPIRDSEGRNMIVVLERNSVQNYDQPMLVQNYIFTRYDSLLEMPNQTGFSLEKGAISGRVDFFTRSVTANPTTELSSENIQKFLRLNQKVLPTNTYYIAFFNTELGIRQNYTGYLINKSLRRYIACYLLDYQPNTKYANFVDLIPKDKRLVPPQLNVSYLPENCDRREAELDSFYSINKDERTGIKKVLLEGKEIRLVMLGLAEANPLLIDLQIYFRDEIGVPVELITDPSEVSLRLARREYNVAVLPVRITDRDPISFYGQNYRNYSGLNLNNRIEKYAINDNLVRYSQSNLQDSQAKASIIDLFQQEFISVNLYRAKQEYNFSNKAVFLGKSLSGVTTFVQEVYLQNQPWFVETKRQWRWSLTGEIVVE